MRHSQDLIRVETQGQGLYEVTHQIQRWLAAQGMEMGLLTVFCRHTSASLTIQENADPDVRRDLLAFFKRIAGEEPGLYSHTTEGLDDMPAHIRAALTLPTLCVPISSGKLALGAWQGIYLFEHRTAPRTRTLLLHLVGA